MVLSLEALFILIDSLKTYWNPVSCMKAHNELEVYSSYFSSLIDHESLFPLFPPSLLCQEVSAISYLHPPEP